MQSVPETPGPTPHHPAQPLLTQEDTWRILDMTPEIIGVAFLLLGWFAQHVITQARRADEDRRAQTELLEPDTTRISSVSPGMLSIMTLTAVFVMAVSGLTTGVALRHTTLGSSAPDERVLLFLLIAGGPGLIAAIVITGLRTTLLTSASNVRSRFRTSHAVLTTPPKAQAFTRDVSFDPTPRQLQLWQSAVRLINREGRHWGLGQGFLDSPQNQWALAARVNQAIQSLNRVSNQTTFTDQDYDTLMTAMMPSIDLALAEQGLHTARLVNRLRELTRAALLVYFQQTNSDTNSYSSKG